MRTKGIVFFFFLVTFFAIPKADSQTFYLYSTVNANKNFNIHSTSTLSWYIRVTSGTLDFGGAVLNLKRQSNTTEPIVLTLSKLDGSNAVSVSIPASGVGSGFGNINFYFTSVQSLAVGNYILKLSSAANIVTTSNSEYVLKNLDGSLIQTSAGVTPTNASSNINPAVSNFSIIQASTASVAHGGTIGYTFSIGNDGGTASGLSTTLKVRYPTGVSPSTPSGLTNCTISSSNSGSDYTYNITLTSAISSGNTNGASFTVDATSPSNLSGVTSNTIHSYSTIDPDGSDVTQSAATPDGTCTTSSCSSASTSLTPVVNASASLTGFT